MKISKISSFDSTSDKQNDYLSDLDRDVENLVSLSNGRIRFGAATDGYRGQNISGEFQVFTSDATPDTEFSVTHTIGAVPVGFLVVYQTKAGSLYQGPTTGTSWTTTTVYFKCNIASVGFAIFLLK